MKLIVMVVDGADVDRLADEMVTAGYPVTKLGSSGGFLRRRSGTLISGVDGLQGADPLQDLAGEIRAPAHPLHLLDGEQAGLEENPARHAQGPHVVPEGGEVNEFDARGFMPSVAATARA